MEITIEDIKKRMGHKIAEFDCCETCVHSGINGHASEYWCYKNVAISFGTKPLAVCDHFEPTDPEVD